MDEFSVRYGDLVAGSYDCVDRIVLNAYFPLGHNPGGFRTWWRRLHGSDDELDNAHLMRIAGRFSRRVKAWGEANGVPVIYTRKGEPPRWPSIDMTKPRIRHALAPAPGGFTVGDFTAKVHALSGHTDYTTRQASYDLRKLPGKELVLKPEATRRYQVPPEAARTVTALVTLRDQVIDPILAGLRSPRLGRKPSHWTTADRHYEKIRIEMESLFDHLHLATAA